MTAPNTNAAVGRVTESPPDNFGNTTKTVAWTIYPAIWWPAGSREIVGSQDQVTWHNTVCLPTGTPVLAADVVIPAVTIIGGAVQYDADETTPKGDQFQVDGQPTAWPANSAGWQHPFSVVVNLTRATGSN